MIEGHRVFTGQSVRENLLLAAYDLPRGEREARIAEALSHFPEIAARPTTRAPRSPAASSRCWRWPKAWCSARAC